MHISATPPLSAALRSFIEAMPKTELHLHIEGTLESELLFALAQRNKIDFPYASVEALRAVYDFSDLQSFLDLYYAGTNVLRAEPDFYDMTMAYIERARADNVRHAEIFCDPQTHTERGIDVVFADIASRLARTPRLFQHHDHVLPASFVGRRCFRYAAALPLRHLSVERHRSGFRRTRQSPPEKFARVFARCKELGFHLVAHAGEEGPPEYVRDALDVLKVERIDHSVRSEEDPA